MKFGSGLSITRTFSVLKGITDAQNAKATWFSANGPSAFLEHSGESTAYSEAPGVCSAGTDDLLASSFAFFPWSWCHLIA